MLYGDLVTLSPGGVLLGSKAVLPIGIFDKSICWGVWVQDATRHDQEHNAHLVLSPLHPRHWPYLLRFELKLKEDVGSMAAAADVLRDHKMNIQFGESSPSGHHHATWNVVCEAVEVRARFESQVASLIERGEHRGNRAALNALATDVAGAMYRAAHDVREALHRHGTFLHERIVNGQPKLLHDPDMITDEEARTAALDDVLQPVRFRWIQNLPKFAFYGVDALRPQAFRFDQKRSILQAEEHDAFERMLQTQGLTDLPTRAVASIYPEEHHVRLIPQPRRQLRQVVQIDLRYRAQFNAGQGGAPQPGDDTSMGLWADACGKLASHGLNLQRVTNKTVRHESNAEEGVLTLIGVQEDNRDPVNIPGLRADLARLPDDLRKRIHLEQPNVSRLTMEQVFVSWRIDAPSGERTIEAAERWAKYFGLQPVVVNFPAGTANLEAHVKERIRACSAMIQIVTMATDEWKRFMRDPAQIAPQLNWLSFEYGMAMGRDIPVVRLVDRSILEVEDWQRELRIGAADVLLPFNSRDPDSLDTKIEQAMQRLAVLVHGDPADG